MLVGREEQAAPAGAGSLAATDETGRDDLGIVEDQAVARIEKGRQIANITVVDRLLVAANDHQAGVAAGG